MASSRTKRRGPAPTPVFNLHGRIAEVLKWPVADTYTFSLPALRDLVRYSDPALADEISRVIQGGAYIAFGGKLGKGRSGMKKRKTRKSARRGFGALSLKKSEESPKKRAKKRAKRAAPKKSAAKKAAPKKSAAKKAAPKKSAVKKARRTPLASKARPKTYLAKPHAPSPRKGPKKCKKCGLYHTVKEHASHRNVPSDWAQTQTVFSGLYGAAPRRSKTDVRLALQAINVELAGPVTPARARKLHAERAKLLARARRAK